MNTFSFDTQANLIAVARSLDAAVASGYTTAADFLAENQKSTDGQFWYQADSVKEFCHEAVSQLAFLCPEQPSSHNRQY